MLRALVTCSTLLNKVAVRIQVVVVRVVGNSIGCYVVGVANTVIANLPHKVTKGVVAVPAIATLCWCTAGTAKVFCAVT